MVVSDQNQRNRKLGVARDFAAAMGEFYKTTAKKVRPETPKGPHYSPAVR